MLVIEGNWIFREQSPGIITGSINCSFACLASNIGTFFFPNSVWPVWGFTIIAIVFRNHVCWNHKLYRVKSKSEWI